MSRDNCQAKKDGPSSTTYYLSNEIEVINGVPTCYIFAGNLRIAKIPEANITYFHKDHLGSSTVMTDTSGTALETGGYLPYGMGRENPGITLSNYKFTDQELDTESGLYNYDARLYDPVIGRFISPDPTVPRQFDPQSLNRYSYCRNNPLIYIDPSGLADGDFGDINDGETSPDNDSYGNEGDNFSGDEPCFDIGYIPTTTPADYTITFNEKNSKKLYGAKIYVYEHKMKSKKGPFKGSTLPDDSKKSNTIKGGKYRGSVEIMAEKGLKGVFIGKTPATKNNKTTTATEIFVHPGRKTGPDRGSQGCLTVSPEDSKPVFGPLEMHAPVDVIVERE